MSKVTKIDAAAGLTTGLSVEGLIAALAHASNPDGIFEKIDPDIDHRGHKIVLPSEPVNMPLRTAIKTLERKAADEETELDVHEMIDAYPEDALVALNEAMRQKYGWASPIPTPSFFGPIPPDLVTVKTGPEIGEEVQVPMGRFTLPGVENPIQVFRHRVGTGMVLIIAGSVRKREAPVVKDLANLTREILKTSSIYRGKAIRLRVDEDGDLDTDTPPEYIQTKNTREDELILNPDELDQVRSALWAPIQYTVECERHGIPLNRGVLLEGPYGTGKTMTANVTAKVCVDNGWTYILLDDVRALKDALLFAKRYAPAVVFAEDADRVADKRDQRGNDLLNTIDGVLTKNSKVITVLTTNFVEKLDKAMLRPGRLDAVVSIRQPGPEAVQKLLRVYGRGLIDQTEDLSEVGHELAGNIPATIREVVERSKLAMIANGNEAVTAYDLLISARGMAGHLALLAEQPAPLSLEHRVGAALGELIAEKAGISDETKEELEDALSEATNDFANLTASNIDAARKVEASLAKGAKATQEALAPIAKEVTDTRARVVKVQKAINA